MVWLKPRNGLPDLTFLENHTQNYFKPIATIVTKLLALVLAFAKY